LKHSASKANCGSAPAKARERSEAKAQEVKVLYFFVLRKKILLFLKKKKQKDFYSCTRGKMRGHAFDAGGVARRFVQVSM